MRNNEEMNTMTKEKKTFAWDTVMTLSLTSDKMTVKGTNTEVKWCPVTEMFWEVDIGSIDKYRTYFREYSESVPCGLS